MNKLKLFQQAAIVLNDTDLTTTLEDFNPKYDYVYNAFEPLKEILRMEAWWDIMSEPARITPDPDITSNIDFGYPVGARMPDDFGAMGGVFQDPDCNIAVDRYRIVSGIIYYDTFASSGSIDGPPRQNAIFLLYSPITTTLEELPDYIFNLVAARLAVLMRPPVRNREAQPEVHLHYNQMLARAKARNTELKPSDRPEDRNESRILGALHNGDW